MCCFYADKAMVLKHHPDKRKAAGEQIVKGDNDYFTCITKGKDYTCSSQREITVLYYVYITYSTVPVLKRPFCYISAIEILSDPVKRRAFDSVDPTFDNTVPSKAEGKENFIEVFAPVFERNAR